MKTQIKELDEKYKVELIMEFDQAESSKAYSKTLKSASKEAKIPGFPPGKIPRSIIEERVGKQYIQQESINQLLQENLDAAITENNLQVLSSPAFKETNYDFDNELSITLSLELRPDIKLDDSYKSTDIAVPIAKLTSEDSLEVELNRLARQVSPKDDVTEEGLQELDTIVMDCLGKFDDGSEMKNPDIKDFSTEVEESKLAPGILPQILGMKAGESKEVKVDFPSDYEEIEYAGKSATYQVTIKKVTRSTPLDLDDELAKKVGFEDLEALKAQIKTDLETSETQLSANRKKALVLNHMIENSEIDLPEWLIQQTAEREAHKHHHHHEGEECDHSVTSEDLESAKRKVISSLLITEISEQEDISISQEEFQKGLQQFVQIMQMMGQQIEQITQEMAHMVREQIIFEKVTSFVVEQAEKLTEVDENDDNLQNLREISQQLGHLPLVLFPQNQ